MRNLDLAVEMMGKHERINVLQQSQTYETAPVELEDQPDFLNRVVEIASDLMPSELLELFHRIEAELGRERELRNGPRSIDLDLLLYRNWIQHTESLSLPHPRMDRRRFALLPLVEIANGLVNPRSGRTYRSELEAIAPDGQKVEVYRG